MCVLCNAQCVLNDVWDAFVRLALGVNSKRWNAGAAVCVCVIDDAPNLELACFWAFWISLRCEELQRTFISHSSISSPVTECVASHTLHFSPSSSLSPSPSLQGPSWCSRLESWMPTAWMAIAMGCPALRARG